VIMLIMDLPVFVLGCMPVVTSNKSVEVLFELLTVLILIK